MKDKSSTIQELKNLVEKFRNERNWSSGHSSKNLAVSIAIEAAELLEHYQWDDNKEEKKDELGAELADIIIYCLFFAVTNEIDISDAVEKKIAYDSKKYPVKVFNDRKDDPREYWRIKKEYRK